MTMRYAIWKLRTWLRPERLTLAEKLCCHMSQWAPSPTQILSEWRREFREIERTEHCRDCPVFSGEEQKR